MKVSAMTEPTNGSVRGILAPIGAVIAALPW